MGGDLDRADTLVGVPDLGRKLVPEGLDQVGGGADLALDVDLRVSGGHPRLVHAGVDLGAGDAEAPDGLAGGRLDGLAHLVGTVEEVEPPRDADDDLHQVLLLGRRHVVRGVDDDGVPAVALQVVHGNSFLSKGCCVKLIIAYLLNKSNNSKSLHPCKSSTFLR